MDNLTERDPRTYSIIGDTEFRHAELTTTPLRFWLTKRRCFGPQSV